RPSGMFAFHPELFEAKAQAQEALDEAGIVWLADYSCCDLLHQEFGLEVEGFHSEHQARRALKVLRRAFPQWRSWAVWFCECHDARWCVTVCKCPPRQ